MPLRHSARLPFTLHSRTERNTLSTRRKAAVVLIAVWCVAATPVPTPYLQILPKPPQDLSSRNDFGNNKPSMQPATIHYVPPAVAAAKPLKHFLEMMKR